MMTIAELRQFARAMSAKQFASQPGPFVLEDEPSKPGREIQLVSIAETLWGTSA